MQPIFDTIDSDIPSHHKYPPVLLPKIIAHDTRLSIGGGAAGKVDVHGFERSGSVFSLQP